MDNIEIKKRYYVKKGVPRVVRVGGAGMSLAGTTEQDYLLGKWIEISEEQADFYTQNPGAAYSEFMNMEMTPPPPPVEIPIEEQYERLVVSKIRAEYSIDDELAILRKRDIEPDKFAIYNTFCENCKIEAKQELGIEN